MGHYTMFRHTGIHLQSFLLILLVLLCSGHSRGAGYLQHALHGCGAGCRQRSLRLRVRYGRPQQCHQCCQSTGPIPWSAFHPGDDLTTF